MITPSQVLAASRTVEASGGSLTEDTSALHLIGVINPELQPVWREIAAEIESSRIGTLRAIDDLEDAVDFTKPELPPGRLRILITKPTTATTFYFFTLRGLSALFGDANLVITARRVLVAGQFDAFQTERCAFQPWTTRVEDETREDPLAQVVPRRFVKDLIGAQVPAAISPFLLVGNSPAQSDVYDTWKSAATKQLLHALVNEVWQEGGVELVQLAGPRSRRIPGDLDATLGNNAFLPATEAARWVYASGRDIETRHTLFTYELARDWPDEMSFGQGFAPRAPRALDAAKISFQSYIREVSKDTIKSLSDLRKTLSEEVTKVSAQTRELVSTMWRDFVVAVTAVLGRIALVLADKPAADSVYARGMLWGTAVFVAASLVLTLYSNSRFMKIAERSRAVWRTRLYGFLPTSDLESLLDNPMSESTAAYRKARNWTIALYALLIVVLVSASLPSLHHASPTTQPGNVGPIKIQPTPTPTPTPTTPTPHVTATPTRSGSK